MQITLPDDERLQRLAIGAGFSTVQEYVVELLDRESRQTPGEAALADQSHEDWIKEFLRFVDSLPSHNPEFEDSRESIYPVR
jgi:hypothetical protein